MRVALQYPYSTGRAKPPSEVAAYCEGVKMSARSASTREYPLSTEVRCACQNRAKQQPQFARSTVECASLALVLGGYNESM